ncbi:MAG: signal peptidase I [Oscillospiraceae bacterium]
MSTKLKAFLKEWVIPLAIEVVVVLFIIKYVVFLVNVPSGSMIPTIDEHSWLFARRVHNPQKALSRGDVVIFDSDEEQKTLIKRLVGMPGETVEVKMNGDIFIDGEKLDEPYVINQETGYEGTFEVPEGHYLFFGDNRSGSWDARYWDNPYISEDDIMGEAGLTILPIRNFGFIK